MSRRLESKGNGLFGNRHVDVLWWGLGMEANRATGIAVDNGDKNPQKTKVVDFANRKEATDRGQSWPHLAQSLERTRVVTMERLGYSRPIAGTIYCSRGLFRIPVTIPTPDLKC